MWCGEKRKGRKRREVVVQKNRRGGETRRIFHGESTEIGERSSEESGRQDVPWDRNRGWNQRRCWLSGIAWNWWWENIGNFFKSTNLRGRNILDCFVENTISFVFDQNQSRFKIFLWSLLPRKADKLLHDWEKLWEKYDIHDLWIKIEFCNWFDAKKEIETLNLMQKMRFYFQQTWKSS